MPVRARAFYAARIFSTFLFSSRRRVSCRGRVGRRTLGEEGNGAIAYLRISNSKLDRGQITSSFARRRVARDAARSFRNRLALRQLSRRHDVIFSLGENRVAVGLSCAMRERGKENIYRNLFGKNVYIFAREEWI